MPFPHFFSHRVNREVRETFAHVAFFNLAISIANIFEPIFLYKDLNLSIDKIFIYFLSVYVLYSLFLPLGGRIVSRLGFKHTILLSVCFQVIYWLLLFSSNKYFGLIYVAPIFYAIQKSLCWPAYHSQLIENLDGDQQGREVSAAYVISLVVSVVGPLFGGLIAKAYNIEATFVVASILAFGSTLPLFISKDNRGRKPFVFEDLKSLYRSFPRYAVGYAGYGEELIVLVCWPIFIFLIAKDLAALGVLVMLATLVASILGLFYGKLYDRSSKRDMQKFGIFISSLIWLIPVGFNNALSGFRGAITLDTFSKLGAELRSIPVISVVYERAKQEGSVAYTVFFEQSLAFGKIAACILGYIAVKLFPGNFTPLFILASGFTLLYLFTLKPKNLS